eukprot:363490-Chlamydomonas_euryale.AAC.12
MHALLQDCMRAFSSIHDGCTTPHMHVEKWHKYGRPYNGIARTSLERAFLACALFRSATLQPSMARMSACWLSIPGTS